MVYHVKDLEASLVDPSQEADAQLDHNDAFQEWNDVFTTVKDGINEGIDFINKAWPGDDVQKLPDEDLYTLLVYPLAGDYGKIQGNGRACAILGTGMGVWSENFAMITADIPTIWRGGAASSFGAHMGTYSLIIAAVGQVVQEGKLIFDAIALVSEELGIGVENAIVALGKMIEKVSKKVLSKVSGIIGMASLALEFISNPGFLNDLVDDLVAAWELINAVQDLMSVVDEWAAAQLERLEAFQAIPDIIAELPKVTINDLADNNIDPNLQANLQSLIAALNTEDDSAALATVRESLDTIQESTDEILDRAED